jgi:uncharacterized protein (DUF362 family)
MNEMTKNKNNLVALVTGDSPQDTVKNGIEKLGGISKFINKGETVFIKVYLRTPELFPINFNFDTLTQLISLCKNAGAKKVIVGSYADEDISITSFDELVGFRHLIESFGAEFRLFQEDSDIEYVIKEIEGNYIKIPSIIMNSDKLIFLNQVNVHPIFQINLSLINSYTMVLQDLQKFETKEREGKDYIFSDQFKQDLITNILNIYEIRKPDLVINDFYYLLEKAGPFVFKDSNLKRTNMMIVGKEALAVDIITLVLMKLDYLKNPVVSEARFRKFGISNLEDIQNIGENIEESKIDIKLPVSRLEDIQVINTDIKTGQYCSGCFMEAYRMLNFLKTAMVKDLKYIINQSFLIGENPQEPESSENILIFGDCAINTTKDRDFRRVFIKKKALLNASRLMSKKKDTTEKKSKLKEKENQRILELPGCPPNFYNCLSSFIKYYGKKNCPNGVFYLDTFKTYLQEKKLEEILR